MDAYSHDRPLVVYRDLRTPGNVVKGGGEEVSWRMGYFGRKKGGGKGRELGEENILGRKRKSKGKERKEK